MSATDELDEVPDAARPFFSEKARREARQRFREGHGRDPTEDEVHSSMLRQCTKLFKEREGRDPTQAEYTAICESDSIPAAALQSFLDDCCRVEGGRDERAVHWQQLGGGKNIVV